MDEASQNNNEKANSRKRIKLVVSDEDIALTEKERVDKKRKEFYRQKRLAVLFLLDVLLKLILIIFLILAAICDFNYGYYVFLRWIVCIECLYFSYNEIGKKEGWIIFFGVAMLLFNPVIKFWMPKTAWHFADIILAIGLIKSAIVGSSAFIKEGNTKKQ